MYKGVQRDDERLGQAGVPSDRVAAQAFSSFDSATIVTVARDTEVAEPIEITVAGPGEGQVAYGHLQIRVEELSRATVVVDLRGSGILADNVEIVVGDSAGVGVIWIADWADDTVHVSSHHARLGKDAVLRHSAVQLGGAVQVQRPTDQEALSVVVVGAGENDALPRLARQRPGGVAPQNIDPPVLERLEPLLRRHRHEADGVGIVEDRGGHGR